MRLLNLDKISTSKLKYGETVIFRSGNYRDVSLRGVEKYVHTFYDQTVSSKVNTNEVLDFIETQNLYYYNNFFFFLFHYTDRHSKIT